jgi:thymidine phosphorylase
MVAVLGGPADVLQDPDLGTAPVLLPVPAPTAGLVAAIDVRDLGQAVVGLGGGRRTPSDRVDPRVGLADVLPLGAAVQQGLPLAWVHAADRAAATAAVAAVQAAVTLADAASPPHPVVHERIAAG